MNHMNDGMYSSASDEYGTPKALFEELDAKWHFDVDVCATPENAKCKKFFTKEDDGLTQDWSKYNTCWMNPPYGRQIYSWVEKAYNCGTTVVCLLPARTDTKWFHEFCLKGDITFIKGRLKFNDGKTPAPFPSMIVVFRGVK